MPEQQTAEESYALPECQLEKNFNHEDFNNNGIKHMGN